MKKVRFYAEKCWNYSPDIKFIYIVYMKKNGYLEMGNCELRHSVVCQLYQWRQLLELYTRYNPPSPLSSITGFLRIHVAKRQIR